MTASIRKALAMAILSNGGLHNNGYSHPLEFAFSPAEPDLERAQRRTGIEFPDIAQVLKLNAKLRRRFDQVLASGQTQATALTAAKLDIMERKEWRQAAPHVRGVLGLAEEAYVCEFDFVGLDGGRHLVVNSFEGVSLMGWSSHGLAMAIQHDGFGTNQWCRQLLTMLAEWSEVFDRSEVNDLVEMHLVDLAVRDIRRAMAPLSVGWQHQPGLQLQTAA